RIYRDIEECETWEAVLQAIDKGLRKYVITPSDAGYGKELKKIKLLRDITEDDLVRLTEIRIKRISKFNSFKADEEIAKLNGELQETLHHLAHLTEYAISYFERLLDKYGKDHPRRTEIVVFDDIRANEVVANNAKLYVDRVGGFLGTGLKKDELLQDCSDIDDIIVFRRDGVMKVVRIGEKVFVGKDIQHIAVWKKNDERTTYNLAYVDGKSGRAMVKRFNVTAITRDKEYPVGGDGKGSRILYLTANPNGESEIVTVTLSPGSPAKVKVFDYDFGELAIKGRDAQGNILTKYPVKNLRQKEVGKSTIGAKKLWYDDITGRLNTQERGTLLGEFDGDLILVLYHDGSYELTDTDVLQRFEPKEILYLGKFDPKQAVSAVHFDGHKGWTMIKRFFIETTKLKERYSYLTDHPKSKLLFASMKPNPRINYSIKVKGKAMPGEVSLGDFMDVKGWKAVGNKLSDALLSSVKEVEGKAAKAPAVAPPPPSTEDIPLQGNLFGEPEPLPEHKPKAKEDGNKKTFKAGDTIEFD
ncbi:MAG: DNA gyrase/topoisomerase IV subunit A, partial [Saprospiraceae bacterium]